MPTPPYRIETPRLVIRCWDPHDAPSSKEAIDSSLEHLRPWMPWADQNPETLNKKIDRLRGFRGRFDAGSDFTYGIFSSDDREVLGGTGLHTRVGEGAFEIGYWIRSSALGQGLATEASAALTRVAFQVAGADRVEIHIDPANRPSARVPAKLGFGEEARLRRRLPPRFPGEPARDVAIFSMLVEQFDDSAASTMSSGITAFDSVGRSLI